MSFSQSDPPPAHASGHPPMLHLSIPTTDSRPERSSTPGHGHPTILRSSETRPPSPSPGHETRTNTPGHGHTTVALFGPANLHASRANSKEISKTPVSSFDSDSTPPSCSSSIVEFDEHNIEAADEGIDVRTRLRRTEVRVQVSASLVGAGAGASWQLDASASVVRAASSSPSIVASSTSLEVRTSAKLQSDTPSDTLRVSLVAGPDVSVTTIAWCA
ncbi:hypothetical protein C8Q79DRAFT_744579 [Trametes meyenii]|nr:hypothetical protein C8Q79DRAFT_744579 [Trametes meyenii]